MARRDHPEDFNAFGYDPRGHVANFAGLMFGENWRPEQQHIPRFDGPQVAPPRFGPPADYQHAHLPDNFVPHLPPYGYLGALQYQHREGPWASHLPFPFHPPPPPHPGHYPPGPQQTGTSNPASSQQAQRQEQLHQAVHERENREVRPGGMSQYSSGRSAVDSPIHSLPNGCCHEHLNCSEAIHH